MASWSNGFKLAIQPLYNLSLAILPRQLVEALPVLEKPIFNVDMNISDLHHNDHISLHRRHLSLGVADGALKTLKLVQLISRGKCTSYHAFISAYPQSTGWVLKKLTATSVTLHLVNIGKAIKIDSEDEVGKLLLSLIESNDISAQISADGTVTFSDLPPQFTKEQVDEALLDVQQQRVLLGYLEQETERIRTFEQGHDVEG